MACPWQLKADYLHSSIRHAPPRHHLCLPSTWSLLNSCLALVIFPAAWGKISADGSLATYFLQNQPYMKPCTFLSPEFFWRAALPRWFCQPLVASLWQWEAQFCSFGRVWRQIRCRGQNEPKSEHISLECPNLAIPTSRNGSATMKKGKQRITIKDITDMFWGKGKSPFKDHCQKLLFEISHFCIPKVIYYLKCSLSVGNSLKTTVHETWTN